MSKKILALGLVLLFSALGLVTEVKASLLNYELTFFKDGGQIGTGSFSFDAGTATNSIITPATLTNLSANMKGYTLSTGPNNDFVYVDDAGLITYVHADLVNTYYGLNLLLNENLTFDYCWTFFNSHVYGTYTVVDPGCPHQGDGVDIAIPLPGTLTLVGTGLTGLWVWRRRRG